MTRVLIPPPQTCSCKADLDARQNSHPRDRVDSLSARAIMIVPIWWGLDFNNVTDSGAKGTSRIDKIAERLEIASLGTITYGHSRGKVSMDTDAALWLRLTHRLRLQPTIFAHVLVICYQPQLIVNPGTHSLQAGEVLAKKVHTRKV